MTIFSRQVVYEEGHEGAMGTFGADTYPAL